MKQKSHLYISKYILYAEDDEDDQAFMKEIMSLTDDSIELVTVENGVETLDYLGKLPQDATLPCFILLDINMPVMDGYETIKKLHADERYQSISVIFFSTASSPTERSRAYALGAKSYITKPFSVEAMKEVCRSFAETCNCEEVAFK